LAVDAFWKRGDDHTELFERSFDENDLFERDVEEDLFERDFDESELMERDIEGEELMERDFDELELMERDFDDSELFERDFGEEELEALERRMTKAQFKQDAHKFGKGLEEFVSAFLPSRIFCSCFHCHIFFILSPILPVFLTVSLDT
jgi:hypothetical protein